MRRPIINLVRKGLVKVDMPGAVRWQLSGGQGRLATETWQLSFSLVFGLFRLISKIFNAFHAISWLFIDFFDFH